MTLGFPNQLRIENTAAIDSTKANLASDDQCSNLSALDWVAVIYAGLNPQTNSKNYVMNPDFSRPY
jgi:hypothetical protein